MTNEQLFKPRYKVIIDYPDRAFEMDLALEYNPVDSCFENSKASGQTIEPEKYPKVFQKLFWFEARKTEDMPQYLKIENRIWKIKRWKKTIFELDWSPVNEIDRDGETENFAGICWHFSKNNSFPATEEEYLTYINSNK